MPATTCTASVTRPNDNGDTSSPTIVLTCVDLQSMEAWSPDKVKDWIQSSVSQCTSTTMTIEATTTTTTNDHVFIMVQPMLKYIKVTDQCIALASTLLKSRAYYQTPSISTSTRHDTNDCQKQRQRPLQLLPRKPHGKPFVPHSTHPNAMSISHQFPICAISQYHPYSASSSSTNPPTATTPGNDAEGCGGIAVGMDVVMFDAPNPKLYATQTEFLDVFCTFFTDWEWNRIRLRSMPLSLEQQLAPSHTSPTIITSHDDTDDTDDPAPQTCCCGRFFSSIVRPPSLAVPSPPRLVPQHPTDHHVIQEFYLRWSIKEAYTKALGVGMGLDFSSFETRLQGIDFDIDPDENNDDDPQAHDKENASIWNVLMEQLLETEHDDTSRMDGTKGVVRLKGHVRQYHDKSLLVPPTVSVWNFYFVPLLLNNKPDDPMIGCACTCVGRRPSSCDDNHDDTNATTTPLPFKVEWRTVEDLISFHTGD